MLKLPIIQNTFFLKVLKLYKMKQIVISVIFFAFLSSNLFAQDNNANNIDNRLIAKANANWEKLNKTLN